MTSEIVRSEGDPPIKVEWRLGTSDGLYKINDVIIDAVSMGASERSDFASVIQRNGGQVGGLIASARYGRQVRSHREQEAVACRQLRSLKTAARLFNELPRGRSAVAASVDGFSRSGEREPACLAF